VNGFFFFLFAFTHLPFPLQSSARNFFVKMKICPGDKTSLLMTVAGTRRFVRQTSRVLRRGSFNNNEPDNLLSSNRCNDRPHESR
jgi:hypothetical protein